MSHLLGATEAPCLSEHGIMFLGQSQGAIGKQTLGGETGIRTALTWMLAGATKAEKTQDKMEEKAEKEGERARWRA